ncbi:hypothetical protein PF005_g14620 [Phytophthora fragariae]|uniref:Uncharacterized protein n=2 Tax=Phytophthora TaxID=4783 RepID=A0A6A3XMY6_9STRA|nr:hypothetical protein PF003_g14791 [Phytophthora fragariae]KAE9025414.1 hypothetical protein PR002_g11205 [Phytophthora rubi]KAE8934053.1 hypothetical protein PF009_g15961 [Phytophthora fragariae]KAE8973893.1 hypothetical protein PF011_g25075 [Phytophthora fragariae]KAE9028226.1 hypothetical protein PR001_g11785 [Phytophthora rubi]
MRFLRFFKRFNLKFVYFCFVCATYGKPRINVTEGTTSMRPIYSKVSLTRNARKNPQGPYGGQK